MTTAHRTALTLAAACVAALAGTSPAHAADGTELTLYRSDSAALYASNGGGNVDDGYAVVREQRALTLAAGTHDVVIGDLPGFLDPEALALGFPGGDAKVVSQRLLLAQGASAALTGLTGHTVDVLGAGGLSLASGTLLRAGDGLLVRDNNGNTTLVSNYAAVRTSGADFPTGASLNLRVDAVRAGQTRAVLSYPTSGLGWRAAYVATLQSGASCRMQFESRASIANRSGRDWRDAQLTLIAGEPNMAKESAPRPMMAMARGFNAKAASADMPQQDSVGDYRSYTLPGAVDLPDGSVSQVPLYASRALDCERTALYENGNSYQPQQPILSRDFSQGGGSAIISTLKLKAFDSLPAGYLRVLTADRNGTPQFIGEGRINDTPKGSDATITLGTAFDLRAERTRTSFSADKAGRTMDEAFRINLSNAGDSTRTVTVREHPSRWRQWTLTSSSSKPSQQTPDTLEFRIEVPANGKATLDYAVRYSWTDADHPQP
ncbi:hypothetical protein GCM10008098_06390 [Rhodanobacter panaciterrae]|uniref:DUF4139 domain-containing protein n=1 Tax=Rhodanobacter panaciterrae TaxID=490572 RepID=A0ABQ2ZME3_9GAMM|nr:DUF4139 domain-containing protein [Rhodanobacter panaciterrae]GGY17460.1 hypothetical protein GCM10008098_06390 [Rhodanobacter panaciterrae]